MAACPSCGAEGVEKNAACPTCGASPLPELELGVRPRVAGAVGKRPRPKPAEPPAPLELAVDPRALIAERHSSDTLARVSANPAVAINHSSARPARPRSSPPLAVGDLAFDARLLAEYGNAPKHWILSPVYAWRVIRRRRELARALEGRRAEAARAAGEAQDALVAFAERVRAVAEKQPTYAVAIEELRRAEEVLRSRDQVLASEQDAQNARLSQVDARLVKLEEALALAQAYERSAAGELAATQAALAREETKFKRSETELRAARQRDSSGEAEG